jgi:hypothetical protein
MLDIRTVTTGEDLSMLDSVVPKAVNVMSIQLGDLEYAPNFGVDLAYFLETEFRIQNESFRSYLVQKLAENQVNVSDIIDTVTTFTESYTIYVGDNNDNSGGLIL